MKLAMIGSYGHTGIVLKSLPSLPDVELVAVARYGPQDKLPFVGKSKAVPAATPVYDDYRKMLDEVRPEVVSICMPLHRNAEASIAAAQHGCHILSEKPLATTLEDLSALRSAVERAGVRICAMFKTRGEPPFQAAREVVAEGRIGKPILAFGQKSYPFAQRDENYRRRQTFGGTIPWVAIHALEFIRYCTGRDYTAVAAMHSNESLTGYEAEDNGGLLLELSGGGHAIISFDYLRPMAPGVKRRHGDDRLRIAGTAGIVEVVDEGTRVVLMTPTEVQDVPLPPPRDLFGEFIASLRGEGEGLVSPEESFRITEVALKARQAADTGQVVAL
ncbi:MAG: Gfo/Idh/MocA family oxidoreductase [Phycisphaerae bacterium]|nr:Gfo/Idh/MocA family oxidoreductase [Phycisphaerae bacterium]